MRLPLEITYRGVDKTVALDRFIRLQAEKLNRFNDHIMSCRVAVERPNSAIRRGSGYRVRLDLTVPPRHELVVLREPTEGHVNDSLLKVIDDAFAAARRQVRKLAELQRGETKWHPEQMGADAVVRKLFADHGFLRPLAGGEDVYFHRHSVLNGGFDELEPGSLVNCVITQGDEGPQASTVKPMAVPVPVRA